MPPNILKWPISSLSGVLIILIFCSFVFASWALYPGEYSPLNNWLSDLGNSGLNPKGAIFFNLGCILAGAATFPFAYGLKAWEAGKRKNLKLRISQVSGFLSGFLLIMVGLFPEDSPAPHSLFSAGFFASFGIFILLSVSALWSHPKFRKPIGMFGLAIFGMNLLFGFAYRAPLAEWITVTGFLIYMGLLAWNMRAFS